MVAPMGGFGGGLRATSAGRRECGREGGREGVREHLRFPREPPGAKGQSEGGHQGDPVYTQLKSTDTFEYKVISIKGHGGEAVFIAIRSLLDETKSGRPVRVE